VGVTPQTLRNWDTNSKLKPSHTSTNGYRYYSHKQLNELLGISEADKKVIGYCRVSSNKQKDDLERQTENMEKYLSSLDSEYEIITDIGSGINYTKKGLRALLKKINNQEISKIVVFYKDRLMRFGFEMLEHMALLNGCEIEVLDSTEKTEEEELVEDLVQIVTVFSCKLQGKRAHKTRKLIEELLSDGAGDDK
jgi:predicted site-specific integrase-resolvase